MRAENKKVKKSRSFHAAVMVPPLLSLIVSVMIMAVYTIVFLWNYRADVIENSKDSMQIYLEEGKDQMEFRQHNLLTIFKTSNRYQVLASPPDEQATVEIRQKIMGDCTRDISLSSDIAGYVLMFDNNSRRDFVFRHGAGTGLTGSAVSLLREQYEGVDRINAWGTIIRNDRLYLSYTYGVRGVSLTVFFQLPDTGPYGPGTEWSFTREEQKDTADELLITSTPPDTAIAIHADKSTITASAYLPQTDVKISANTPYLSMLNSSLVTSYIFIIGIAIIVLISAYFSRRYIRLIIEKPFSEMETTMRQIREGGIQVRMPVDTKIMEYNDINMEFNKMMDEIQSLKIDQYERTILQQKTQLQFLRMQMKPHFILNCLTSLYSMLQQKKLEKVGDRIIDLSNYLRYEMQSEDVPRTLEEELAFTDSEIAIRRDAFENEIIVREAVPDELLGARVPAMVLETFVENSIKYANPDGDLEIHISVSEQSLFGERYLRIHITDNGKGYSEKILKAFSEHDERVFENHVGLNNLYKRMEILYHGKAVMSIKNNGGAVNEILIPLGGDDGDDVTDRR